METHEPRKGGNHAQASEYVKLRIRRLAHAGNDSLVRAALAHLRRGIGKAPGSLPELWSQTMDGMPQALAGDGGNPSQGEWAIYIALTLFALHQQSKNMKLACMHMPGQGLGKALRKLIATPEEEPRIKRRFDQVVTAEYPEELSHHLRGLIQLLRAADIPLDYGVLASDLYLMQVPQWRDKVRLQWGRDFYTSTFVKELSEEPEHDAKQEKGEDQQNEEK